MNFKDNIISGYSNWNPVYRFVLGRVVKWDNKQFELVSVVDDAALAYILFKEYQTGDKGTSREYLYNWVLLDSFHKDALEFCKKLAENPIVDVSQEVKT